MALADEIEDDFEVVDGLQSVSYFRRTAEGTFASAQTVRSVLRREAFKEEIEAAGGGQLARDGVVFHLWVRRLAGTVPKKHDVVRDAASVRWTVLEVRRSTLDTRYRVLCVKER